jgi:hypothetical protein
MEQKFGHEPRYQINDNISEHFYEIWEKPEERK